MPKKDHKAQDQQAPVPKKSAVAVRTTLPNNAPRKNYEPPKSTWEELTNIADAVAAAVIGTAESVNVALQVQQLTKDSALLEKLHKVVSALQSDLEAFADSVAKIRATHEGKTGTIDSPEELSESILIFDQYFQLNLQYVAVTTPLVQEVMAVVDEIHRSTKAAAPEQPQEADAVQPESEQPGEINAN